MKKLCFILFVLIAMLFTNCDTVDNQPGEEKESDIPIDPPGLTLPATVYNNISPLASIAVSTDDTNRIQVHLQKVVYPGTNQAIVLNYNKSSPASSNIFISQDNVVKGLKVTRSEATSVLNIDIVFTIDNSGSMAQEADIIAPNVLDFAEFLNSSGFNARFAVVGYYGLVTGGLNFTDKASLANYLNRSWGSERTEGFVGPDSSELEEKSFYFAVGPGSPMGQNGTVAMLFADSNYSWRQNSNRIFINFTDDGIHSSGDTWNNEYVCNLLAGRATVHTVFSEDTTFIPWSQFIEKPWGISHCTGGQTLFVSNNEPLLNLSMLPVTKVNSNNYLIEFEKNDSGIKNRVVKIVVKESGFDGYKIMNVIY